MAAVTIYSDFGAPQNKVCHCFHCFPIYLHEMMGSDAMILVFWMFSFKIIGRNDAEAETPILWPPDVQNWLIGKDPDAGKDWRWEEKGMTEVEMVGWHHRLDGHEFEQDLGEGQGSLACCCPWGCKQLDTTEWLNNNRNGALLINLKQQSVNSMNFGESNPKSESSFLLLINIILESSLSYQ